MAKNRLSKEKWQKWEERKRLILSYDFHLTDTSKEREERVDHARRDYAYFVETYFSASLHRSGNKTDHEVW